MNNKSDTPEIVRLKGYHGIKWLADSFALFLKQPGSWLLIWLLYFAFNLLFILSSILVLLPVLLSAAFSAGFVYAAKTLDDEGRLSIENLFYGFKFHFRALFRLGMFYMLIVFIFGTVLSLVIDNYIDQNALTKMREMPQQELQLYLQSAPQELQMILKAIMISFVLCFPFIMMTWHAPALVLLDRLTPIEAMALSFKACYKNIQPFIIFWILIISLFVFSAMTLFGLPIALVIISISQYTSYRSSFRKEMDFEEKNGQGTFIV